MIIGKISRLLNNIVIGARNCQILKTKRRTIVYFIFMAFVKKCLIRVFFVPSFSKGNDNALNISAKLSAQNGCSPLMLLVETPFSDR